MGRREAQGCEKGDKQVFVLNGIRRTSDVQTSVRNSLDTNNRSWFSLVEQSFVLTRSGVSNMAATMSSPFRTVNAGRASTSLREPLRPTVLGGLSSGLLGPTLRQRPSQFHSQRARVGGVLVDPRGFVGDELDGSLRVLQGAPSVVAVRQVSDRRLRSPLRPVHRQGSSVLRSIVVAVGLLLLVLAGVVVGNGVASAGPGSNPRVSSRSAMVTVEHGDSMWIIARRIQPTGDIRPLVQAMIDSHGTAAIDVGDTLLVPLP